MDKAQQLIQAAGSLRAAPQTSAVLDMARIVMTTAVDHAKLAAEEVSHYLSPIPSMIVSCHRVVHPS